MARATQPARRARTALRGFVDGDPGAALGAQPAGAARVVRRMARGVAGASGGAASHAVAHGVAHDARGSAADRLSGNDRLSVGLDDRRRGIRPAHPRYPWTVGLRRDAGRAVKLAKDIMWSRRTQRELLARLTDLPPLESHRFRVGVYFADGRLNLYQLRQWYKPLAELAQRHPVLILSRASGSALELLDESPVPVAYVRRVVDLEQVIHEPGPAHRVLREPEREELPDDALRPPLARVHQSRRVRQDVHDHEPVQGVRLCVHRGRRGQGAAREGALGLRLRQARHPDRSTPGRSLPRRRAAAVHARPARGRALRADVGGRPRRRGVRLDRDARRRAGARAARIGPAPGDLPAAPAFGRRRPRVRCGEPRDHRGDRGRERRRPRSAACLRRRAIARLAARGGGCCDRRHLGDGLRSPRRRQAAAHHSPREL